jgi:serine/threonine protein kinase
MKSERKDELKKKLLSSTNQLKQTVCDFSQPAIGDILDNRYELTAHIGRGGMGIVFKAFDRELEMDVAIKVLPLELSGSQRAIQDLKGEAKLAMMLHHPSIVALYHFAHSGPVKYLVMELLSGQSLEEKLQKEEILELSKVVSIANQLAEALDYAHSQMVVHRDIKPDNIFIHEKNGKEQIRLMDFGIARQIKESMTRLTKQDSSGTILYMAPEQMEGNAVDGRADIYALGATVYECLAGNPPFYKGSISYQIANKAPTPIESVPKEINDALMVALAKHPEDRYATAADFARALAGDIVDETLTKTESIADGPAIASPQSTADNEGITFTEVITDTAAIASSQTTADPASEASDKTIDSPLSAEKKPEFIMDEDEDSKSQSVKNDRKAKLPSKVGSTSKGSIPHLNVDGPLAVVKIWKSLSARRLFLGGLVLFLLPTILCLLISLIENGNIGLGLIEILVIFIPVALIAYIAYYFSRTTLCIGADESSSSVFFDRAGTKVVCKLNQGKSSFLSVKAPDYGGGFMVATKDAENGYAIEPFMDLRLSTMNEAIIVAGQLNSMASEDRDGINCLQGEKSIEPVNLHKIVRYICFGFIISVLPFIPLSQKWVQKILQRNLPVSGLISSLIVSIFIAFMAGKFKFVKSSFWIVVSTVCAFFSLNTAIVWIAAPILSELSMSITDETMLISSASFVIIISCIVLRLLPTK